MKVLLIGCGKMGSLIARSLQNNSNVETLSIVDPGIWKDVQEHSISCYPKLTPDLILSSDCVFIATPASTHCTLITELLINGHSNIYVEKPAVVSQEEYDQVQALCTHQRIVTGYILRQSPPVNSMKRYLRQSLQSGWHLVSCCVTYQKYLPFQAENRTQHDIGVFEEIVHIWDLLFNYLDLRSFPRTLEEQRLEMDPQRKERTLKAFLSYELKQENASTRVEIHSSFNEPQRKREFVFALQNALGQEQFMTLSFDNTDEMDHLTVTDSDGQVIYQESAPALEKLDHQIGEVLHYFESGEIQDLAAFHESDIINKLLAEINPEIQL